VIVDRQGKLAANFEGNEFSAAQLGDFVSTVLEQPIPNGHDPNRSRDR
jgi:hypothetical protein